MTGNDIINHIYFFFVNVNYFTFLQSNVLNFQFFRMHFTHYSHTNIVYNVALNKIILTTINRKKIVFFSGTFGYFALKKVVHHLKQTY